MKEKVRILIVDDDPDMLETLGDILKEKGYETITAKSGKEAIAKAEKRFFNVALVDIGLPDMTGVEVLQVFERLSPYTMNVVITGRATKQNAIESVNVGASAYIMKPVDQDALDKILDECLKKQQLIILPNEVPACLRRPDIRLLLQAIRDKKITEFKPSIDDEKGVFYPEIEKILPDPSEYFQVFEILEKYGILKRDFCDTVLACPSCDSSKISVRFSCPTCRSTNIGRQFETFFKCYACGKETSMPERKYICSNCKAGHGEDQLKMKKLFTFVVSSTHELLIDKWIEDLDNMLASAREFYRSVLPPYDTKRPQVSYAVLAKKGEGIRHGEGKA